MICDCHIHIVADPGQHPQLPDRTYTAGPAPLDAIRRAASPVGVGRFVVVQPSFYGTDNSVTLEATAQLGPNGRAVAVIDPAAITQPQLDALAQGGTAGLRINLYSTLAERRGSATPFAATFAATQAIARRQSWHVEVIAQAATLARHADLFAQSATPIVIDHYGVHGGEDPDGDTGRALLGLLRLPHVWMKLSAPYRCRPDELATRPDPAWLHAILDAGAERCVWGSDWPHTAPHGHQTGDGIPLPYRKLGYPAVLEGLRAALPPHLVQIVLEHNPVRLYGFAS